MKDLALGTLSHDIVVDNGDLLIVDSVPQHVKQRILTILGEWFLDLSIGLPWFDEILGKGTELTLVEALLKQTITDTPGVRELVSFRVEASQTSERTALVSFTITLSNGDEVVSALEV